MDEYKSERTISVVLKTVERCNINCSYCYFFNGKDDSFKFHPPFISKETILKAAEFLRQGCQDLDATNIFIILHGGEPLMQKPAHFEEMCEVFKSHLHEYEVIFAIQTNAMLINDVWIDLFKKYDMSVGVSIDGPAEYHDKYRVDKKGRGTHHVVEQKLKKLLSSEIAHKVSILSVLNPEFDAKTIYHYFARELKLKRMDFLFMDYNYDSKPPFTNKELAEFAYSMIAEWVKDSNPEIQIRFIDSILDLLKGGASRMYGVGAMPQDLIPLITIASDGSLSPTDELSSTNLNMMHTKNINSISFKEYISSEVFEQLNEAFYNSPTDCKKCCWEKICNGGGIVNRYSTENGFNNPSIYCDALKYIYSTLSNCLIKFGYSKDEIEANLGLIKEVA